MRAYVQSQTGILLRRFATQATRTARTADADSIHDLRVAIRRLSRCLRVFAQFYPPHSWKPVRRRLADLMDSCGSVRDCDIAIELLKQASSIGDAAMWKIKYEWLKPGVREREIEANVHQFMLERGCEIIYDIIVASGENTSPYRRWATDKLIRQGDLVIVDINAVGPSGYFIDFVRCFKCGGAQGMKMTQKEIGLYREVYDSMYAGLEKLRPGNTTADVVAAFPEYDDDKYGTVTLQQFAHSIGITLYEGMWMSRAYSMKFPAEIKENMYFAIETFAGHPGLQQTCRLEENVLVSGKGPVVFTLMEHMEEAMKR